MDIAAQWLNANSTRLLRATLAIVVFWIGALKFLDPTPVVDLLGASLPFLAFAGFVYALAVVEIAAATLLVLGRGLRVVPLILAGMFVSTLFIFLSTPSVAYGEAGFPSLSLAGEFLLKDIVLLAATLTVFADANETARAQGTAPSLDRTAATSDSLRVAS